MQPAFTFDPLQPEPGKVFTIMAAVGPQANSLPKLPDPRMGDGYDWMQALPRQWHANPG